MGFFNDNSLSTDNGTNDSTNDSTNKDANNTTINTIIDWSDNGMLYTNSMDFSWTTTPYVNSILTNSSLSDEDYAEKCLDLEKLEQFTKSKREMIFDIFKKYIETEEENKRTLLYNTLKQYNVIVNEKAMQRRIKINNLLKK